MVSFGSSVINKSQKKLAPRVPRQHRGPTKSATLPPASRDNAVSAELHTSRTISNKSCSKEKERETGKQRRIEKPSTQVRKEAGNDAGGDVEGNDDTARTTVADDDGGVQVEDSQPIDSAVVDAVQEGSITNNGLSETSIHLPHDNEPGEIANGSNEDVFLNDDQAQLLDEATAQCSLLNQEINQDQSEAVQGIHPSLEPQTHNQPQTTHQAEQPLPANNTPSRHTRKRKAKSNEKDVPASSRKRGRREAREDTPEDAEEREIAPGTIRMNELCKDPRIGRKSKLEMSMRQIDWSEVVRKRKEAGRPANTVQGHSESEVNERLERAARERESALTSGPQLRVVNGQMVVDQTSLTIDRRAEASRNEDALEEVEENDLTARINSHSWLYDKKRDPAERGRPLKSDRWTSEQTEAFYDALRMFGTDFFIISRMFPGKTRRQIKLKFVREERSNPVGVKAALVGESVPMDFDTYLTATGQDKEAFKDPKELEAELLAENDKHKEEIEKRKAEHAELMRQRKAAGADTDGDTAGSSKEQGRRKGKRAKKTAAKPRQAKRPIGGDEVEVLGDD